MKKLLTVALTGAIAIPSLLGGTNASAQSVEEELTKEVIIDWELLWESAGTLSSFTEFGLQTVTSDDASLYSLEALAVGRTEVHGGLSSVTARGTTTGNALLAVTSATTSLRDVAYGITNQGSKGMGIGSVEARSSASLTNTTGLSPFNGITVHTASHEGKLYSSTTGNAKSF